MQGIIPYLQFENTDAAIAWYEEAFDAKEVRVRLVAPDGTCMNAELEIFGSRIMLADEMPSVGSSSPSKLEATTVVLSLHVKNVDAVFQKAISLGATAISPMADQFHGERSGRIRDPFGHHWILSKKVREVSDDEMLSSFNDMFK